ncbi:hypothetical protein [Rhizobium halophytocola]|uniref:Uncharacterized protein n=1 Tax=Rhizobium halophytocola TaxID=735519 RepID=A0ABS4E311_9HYPH|nr:hypothetical protein [Rhizobium halophytocola]MBP1852313.1 hypothetical protein [Rhizobium halophytocola]
MSYIAKIALAGMLATSSLSGVAMAQTAMDDNVTVIRIDSLDKDSDKQDFQRLSLIANDPAQMQQAQAMVTQDPALSAELQSESVQMENVVAVETAADGGKVVYVK